MSVAEAVTDARVAASEWLGFPKGAWLIIGVEFWERFSFYGMLSILALFLTDRPAHGGFGWSATAALALVGGYSGAMYALPAIGGYFADRVLGRRAAVKLGATFMLIGQVMLTSPLFLPALLGWWHQVPLLRALHELSAPLGELPPSASTLASIRLHGAALDAVAGAGWLQQGYLLASLGFAAAIGCLILGNSLMKSTLVVLCGETMSPRDPRREGAYAYYYLGISIGAMLSGIAVGATAQRYGWYAGFAVGAMGMAIALGCYRLLAARWLGTIGVLPERAAGTDAPAPNGTSAMRARAIRLEAGRRIALILVLALLLCAFSLGWFQLFGSWALFIEHDVNRTVGSFVIPVPWFSSLNAAVVILLAPFVATLWVRLGARNRRIDIVQKYSFALAMVAAGHFLMWGAARIAARGAPAPVWIPLISLSMLAVGELVAWTATYGMVSRAAPAGYASVTMGAWYLLTLGLGGYLSGYAGRLVDAFGYANAFATIASLMAATCGVAIGLRSPLARMAGRAGVSL